MRIFYVTEDSCVGAHFVGTSKPTDDLVRKYGFKADKYGIYCLELTEDKNACEIHISYSEKGIMLTGLANNKRFLSDKIREMLAEVETTDLPKSEQWSAFMLTQPYLRIDVRHYATEQKS